MRLEGQATKFSQGQMAMAKPRQAGMFHQPMGMYGQGPMGFPGQSMGGFRPKGPAFRGRMPIDKLKSMCNSCTGTGQGTRPAC